MRQDFWFTNIKQMRNEEYSFLEDFISNKTQGNILEIGQGGSTVIILDATADTDRKLTSIDINFKLKDVMKHLPKDYIERFNHIKEDSHKVSLKEKFGVILIDGEHYGNSIRKDTMNFWDNLEDNGYCIFHDYNLFNDVTKFVDDWISKFNQAKVYEQNNNLIVVKKC